MDTIAKLEEIFRHFPGIGPRQAKRFVYHLLTRSNNDISELSKLVLELKQHIQVCQSCFRFFPLGNKAPQSTCSICSNENRDHQTLMIVSRDIDMEAVEKSRAYTGIYFILGGSVPILDEQPEARIRQAELLKRINELSNIKEIILATSVNPEGEHTAMYLSSLLKPLSASLGFKISTLGRGLSTGTELEYSDSETLKSALENRR
jgi:recombination protein RecR